MKTSFIPFFPLVVGQEEYTDSDYLMITEPADLVRQNLINLLLTSPGERMMEPEFGVGIKRYLFEMNVANTRSLIDGAIRGQIKRYMPFVSIKEILFNTPDDAPNSLGVSISYFAPGATNQQEINIEITNGNLRCG
jgi:phage baseplate assembly protein W